MQCLVLLFTSVGLHFVDNEDGEPVRTDPADVVDILNEQHDTGDDADQAPARKNRKAAVVESDEEDEVEHREAQPTLDKDARNLDDVAAPDVNMAEAFGSDSGDDGV